MKNYQIMKYPIVGKDTVAEMAGRLTSMLLGNTDIIIMYIILIKRLMAVHLFSIYITFLAIGFYQRQFLLMNKNTGAMVYRG